MSIEADICNYLLEKGERVPQNELLKIVSCSEATLSRKVKKLENQEIIKKENEREGRTQINYITLINKDFNFQLSSNVKVQRKLKAESSIDGISIKYDELIRDLQNKILNVSGNTQNSFNGINKIIEELQEKISKPNTQKMSYEDFKQFILNNRNKGTHYSSYCKQLKYKDSDFRNFYLIYLDLP